MASLISHVGTNAVAEQKSCTIDFNTQSTEASTRDLAGTMHNEFLPSKWKLIAVWSAQTLADRATLMTAIKSQPNLSRFTVTFLNPDTGEYDSSHYFMLGTPINQKLLEGTSGWWDEVEVHFIEL